MGYTEAVQEHLKIRLTGAIILVVLVVSLVPETRICVTRRAILGFHAARSVDRRGHTYAEPEASQLVLQAYPTPVRDWIIRHGGLTSRLLLLRGRELATIYPRCR